MTGPRLGTVYLLHFVPPAAPPPGWRPLGARHYVGFTGDLPRRLYDHRHNGTAGARTTHRAVRQGYALVVAAVLLDVPPLVERQVKRLGGLSRFCGLCGGTPALLAELLPGDLVVLDRPEVVPVRRRPASSDT